MEIDKSSAMEIDKSSLMEIDKSSTIEIDKSSAEINDEYFCSYTDLQVHQLMLTDYPRIEAYKTAIFSNKDYFHDKYVMDVGSGTGILSIFCAQAGAKKVYAVEASSLAQLSKRIIEKNNLSHIIEVLNDRVEDIEIPENRKVDVIVSEWMGFYLLHEGMLDSVLVARDKHLKKDGKMFPESAVLYACLCSIPQLYGFWENFEGVNMSVFGDELRKSKNDRPDIMTIDPKDLISKPIPIFELDLYTVQVKDLDHFSTRQVVCCQKESLYQGLCLWFTCKFPSANSENAVTLCTSPTSSLTHWKQTVVVLPNEYPVEEGEPVAWVFNLSRSIENSRHYNIQLDMVDPESETHPVPCECYMTKCIVTRTFLECEEEPNDIIDIT